MGDLSLDRSLAGHFAVLDDRRDALRQRHKRIEMVVIAIAAVLCGADGWVGIAAFGRTKEDWLRQFLELPNGIPAHDTFGRVFAVLTPGAFEACFRAWACANRVVLGQVATEAKSNEISAIPQLLALLQIIAIQPDIHPCPFGCATETKG